MRRCKMAYAYARPKWTRWAPGKPANLSNYLNLAGRYEFPHAWRKFANAKKDAKATQNYTSYAHAALL